MEKQEFETRVRIGAETGTRSVERILVENYHGEWIVWAYLVGWCEGQALTLSRSDRIRRFKSLDAVASYLAAVGYKGIFEVDTEEND